MIRKVNSPRRRLPLQLLLLVPSAHQKPKEHRGVNTKTRKKLMLILQMLTSKGEQALIPKMTLKLVTSKGEQLSTPSS